MVRHAAGVTQLHAYRDGIRHSLDVFVDATDPVKFSLLTLTNEGGAARPLSVFAYNEWVAGAATGGQNAVTSSPSRMPRRGAILATNAYNHDFRAARPSRTRASGPVGHRRPDLVPGAQRLARPARGAVRERSRGSSGPASIPARRCRSRQLRSGRDAPAGLPPRAGKGRAQRPGVVAPPWRRRAGASGARERAARLG